MVEWITLIFPFHKIFFIFHIINFQVNDKQFLEIHYWKHFFFFVLIKKFKPTSIGWMFIHWTKLVSLMHLNALKWSNFSFWFCFYVLFSFLLIYNRLKHMLIECEHWRGKVFEFTVVWTINREKLRGFYWFRVYLLVLNYWIER